MGKGPKPTNPRNEAAIQARAKQTRPLWSQFPGMGGKRGRAIADALARADYDRAWAQRAELLIAEWRAEGHGPPGGGPPGPP